MRRSAALALALGALGCDRGAPLDSAPAPAQRTLPADVAARVGPSEIRLGTVQRIAAAQGIELRSARERAVFDALAALEGERVLSPARVNAGRRAAQARALLESLTEQARARGPALDAELDQLLRERWLEFDRPEAARVVHAVALVPRGGDRELGRQVGLELQRALAGVRDPDEFRKRAGTVAARGEVSVRAESLPPITPDARGFRFGPLGVESVGDFDREFTRAAHALREPGDQSGLVETSFGFHVLLLEERLPAQRLSSDEARRLLQDDVVARRAEREYRGLLERLERTATIQVSRNFDALTAALEPSR